jgi:glutathione S-transferase
VAEKDIAIDFEQVDLESDAHLRSDYYDPGSTGDFRILVLDDASYLFESVAICRYLERLQHLLPVHDWLVRELGKGKRKK